MQNGTNVEQARKLDICVNFLTIRNEMFSYFYHWISLLKYSVVLWVLHISWPWDGILQKQAIYNNIDLWQLTFKLKDDKNYTKVHGSCIEMAKTEVEGISRSIHELEWKQFTIFSSLCCYKSNFVNKETIRDKEGLQGTFKGRQMSMKISKRDDKGCIKQYGKTRYGMWETNLQHWFRREW